VPAPLPVCSGSDRTLLIAASFLGSVTRPVGVSDTWNSAHSTPRSTLSAFYNTCCIQCTCSPVAGIQYPSGCASSGLKSRMPLTQLCRIGVEAPAGWCLPSTNHPPSDEMRACFTLRPNSVRHWTTCTCKTHSGDKMRHITRKHPHSLGGRVLLAHGVAV
jgi:hypothetical protein